MHRVLRDSFNPENFESAELQTFAVTDDAS